MTRFLLTGSHSSWRAGDTSCCNRSFVVPRVLVEISGARDTVSGARRCQLISTTAWSGLLRQEFGTAHWAFELLSLEYGASARNYKQLDLISPVNYAESFSAAVLLIHEQEDLIIPIDQSNRMYKSLKRAKKPVTFVRLKDEDHHLSSSSTRVRALESVDTFLKEYLPN